MPHERIMQEAASIASGIEASKARAMIYQAGAKEDAARSHGLPLDSFYDLPFEQWRDVYRDLDWQGARDAKLFMA